jgi:hypothetical protein
VKTDRVDCLVSSSSLCFVCACLYRYSRIESGVVVQSQTSGALSTSLAADVFSLIGIQGDVLHDFLVSHKIVSTKEGDTMLVDGLLSTFRELKQTQFDHRSVFLATLEASCAAANDFFRMSELMEAVMADLIKTYPFLDKPEEDFRAAMLLRECSELVGIFTQDAVYAAERTHVFILQAVNSSSIRSDFFSEEWEDDWTSNEVAVAMAKLFDRDLVYIQRFLCDTFLYDKAVVGAAKALVCFYVHCLIEKAHYVRCQRKLRNRIVRHRGQQAFRDHERALQRMHGDITVLRDFILDKVKGQNAPGGIITNEFSFVELIHEWLRSEDLVSRKSLTIAIHKRIMDASVTRHFIGDLWQLSKKQDGKEVICRALASLEPSGRKELPDVSNSEISFVSLAGMMRGVYKGGMVSRLVPMTRGFIPSIHIVGRKLIVKQIRTMRSVFELQEENQV